MERSEENKDLTSDQNNATTNSDNSQNNLDKESVRSAFTKLIDHVTAEEEKYIALTNPHKPQNESDVKENKDSTSGKIDTITDSNNSEAESNDVIDVTEQTRPKHPHISIVRDKTLSDIGKIFDDVEKLLEDELINHCDTYNDESEHSNLLGATPEGHNEGE